MEKVTKLFFDPLLSSRDDIQSFLKTLPVGAAHSCGKELLVHSETGVITSIDISMHPEDYFSNAVSLGDLGEDVLTRMRSFPKLQTFNDEYSIQQAPSSSFTVPIVDGEIHIFAVSVLDPSFYDLCVGDPDFKTSCFHGTATATFKGLVHSGDVRVRNILLQHIEISSSLPQDKAHAVFVSGYEYNQLRKYKAHNPLVLVANHETKVLYIIPVPLDPATIGDARLCCPLVIKKGENGDLACQILSTPATENELICTGPSLKSPMFATAVERATFTKGPDDKKEDLPPSAVIPPSSGTATVDTLVGGDIIVASRSVDLPSIFRNDSSQIIRYGKGLHWMSKGESESLEDESSSSLPIILGNALEGPMMLALGEIPVNVPFHQVSELHQYYEQAKSIVVVVNNKMSDNARNLAPAFRLNGLFIVQTGNETPQDKADVTSILDKVNINAITAFAGPQSLILIQIGNKYFFYRGLADPEYLDTSVLKYGHDLTTFICDKDLALSKLSHPSWPKMVDLRQENPVYLPKMNTVMNISQLEDAFKDRSLAQIDIFRDDILSAVTQLQVLLAQEKLQHFCSSLIDIVNHKVKADIEATKKEYVSSVHAFLNSNGDPELRKEKERLLGVVRGKEKETRENIQWLIEALGNIVSSQTTSSRTHDLKRLIRQNTIKNNVAAAKEMTFDQVGDMLDEHASRVGVLIVNIDAARYLEYLGNGNYLTDNAAGTNMCTLDPRTIHLDGLTAGILLEQTQKYHNGPLVCSRGPQQPILALGSLKHNAPGSVLAWVCWDEFIDANPYSIRWMEKCNDSHIAAARILMRSTLSEAISSRSVNLTPGAPATGHLMAALLMVAMQKLAATRSSLSTVGADDTTTLLMRGLFGNLLTIAGSGTKPMSFVWQLFGGLPNFDIPSSANEWIWYETVVRLIPFTGWQLSQFKDNLTNLLDKLIFRMMTRNEVKGEASKIRKTTLQEYCKARNIQLLHSRTIITILKTMLTDQKDCTDAAKRLLKHIPEHVEHETESYRRLYRAIVHLANGGTKRVDDNLVAAGVFSKRAASFQAEKKALSKIAKPLWYEYDDDPEKNDDPEHKKKKFQILMDFSQELRDKTIEACEQVFKARVQLEKEWGLKPGTVKVQNLHNVQIIHDKCISGEKITRLEMESLQNDAENIRVPWLIGEGKYGSIETLDENFVKEILGGDDAEKQPQAPNTTGKQDLVPEANEFEPFTRLMKSGFLTKVQAATSVQDVCGSLGITRSAVEAFSAMLSPDFNSAERLPNTFKRVVLKCLRDRDREKVKPTKMLFEMHDMPNLLTSAEVEGQKSLEFGV